MDIDKLESLVYQIDVAKWRAVVFDATDKHHRKLLQEQEFHSRYAAEQFVEDMNSFYLCELEVSNA